MPKGTTPPPFVVARGDDPLLVFDEVLKHTGFFEMLEERLKESGKRREMFEIVAKVDFLHATRKEDTPVSYVDPKLVTHLFNQLLDRGFRVLRVMEKTNELARFHRNRSVKQVGKALGYDESCYELRDFQDELYPVDFGAPIGMVPTGKTWQSADCRLVFAKNRTHETFGPALVFYNLLATLASPTELVALERGVDPHELTLASLRALPVHYAIVEAVYSRDGCPGTGGPFQLLSDPDGGSPEKAAVLQTDILVGGQDVIGVEAAGEKMQGVAPLEGEVMKLIRRNTGYTMPREVEELPIYQGWRALGSQIRELFAESKPEESYRCGLWQSISDMDARLFPPQPGGWQHVRLRERTEAFLDKLRKQHGDDSLATADPAEV